MRNRQGRVRNRQGRVRNRQGQVKNQEEQESRVPEGREREFRVMEVQERGRAKLEGAQGAGCRASGGWNGCPVQGGAGLGGEYPG